MKVISILLCLIMVSSVVLADNYGRVCLKKADGKLIEFQSGDAPLGTLTKNAIAIGHDPNDIEEKYVTKSEWNTIDYNQITKPTEDKIKADKAAAKIKKNKAEQELKVLGLSDDAIDGIFNRYNQEK